MGAILFRQGQGLEWKGGFRSENTHLTDKLIGFMCIIQATNLNIFFI